MDTVTIKYYLAASASAQLTAKVIRQQMQWEDVYQ